MPQQVSTEEHRQVDDQVRHVRVNAVQRLQ